jgi:hypothetical protein
LIELHSMLHQSCAKIIWLWQKKLIRT